MRMNKVAAGATAGALLAAGVATTAAAAPAGRGVIKSEAAAPSTVNTYAGNWDRTWRNGRVRTDTTDAVQGLAVGGRNVAQIGFPTGVYNDLAAAKSVNPSTRISKVEVWLYPKHTWYNSGGAADIGVHANATRPATFKYSGSYTVPVKKYVGKWVTLPSTWLPGWNSGNTKGITLGGKAQASSDAIFYARFGGTTDQVTFKRPLVRVTLSAD